MSRSGSQGLYK
ncbi:hypothetical protein VTL71DRAFT_9432 [Oculimacula yallundae]|uniref:Uncharacterized protein n=1 Tax=Oculimacula yallundae TaxID=86028 RepID=A0ABR4BRV4_9HELO